MATNSSAVSQDTLITIKISVNEQLKKLKLPLRELNITSLTPRLRQVLDIKPEQTVVLERYSDSAGGYITLDEKNPQVFKTLIRAAKAKGKLRLKATVTPTDVPQEKEAPVEAKKVAVKTIEPIIVRSTGPMGATFAEEKSRLHTAQPQPRDPISLDQRNIGSGIFQFREARASQQTLVDDAPVPHPFSVDRTAFFDNLAAPAARSMLPIRPREPREKVEPVADKKHEWAVFCNECSKALPDSHYHCDICDDADYDLCEQCVAEGKLCPGEGHWLIKRFLKDGQFITSTTERVSPRKFQQAPLVVKSEPEIEEKMPGAFAEETKPLNTEPMSPTRTCNNCVIVLPEREFVHCTSCEDFDLCIKCHMADKHGHHPAHGFELATDDTVLPLAAETKLAPGRNVRHNAICDGCDKKIYGVRHKCLNCPDWDYCNDCVENARHTHPRHRFAPLYTPIADQGASMVRHFGIYCDGPLCSQKAHASYIQGVRYKCTICHDTDFCANCEALPGNHHNRTHPLIKLKTPVRNVNVSTENEDLRGNVRVMGDRHAEPAAPAGLVPIPVNAATPVQTVAEIKPTEVKKESLPVQIPVKKFEAFPDAPQAQPFKLAPEVPMSLLNAHFVRDSIPDGMAVEPETQITQIWTLKNPGPYTWPAGCSVRYVGGDNMLNVDNSHPASVAAINEATESNVVGREVAVGEEVAFKVVLKAPVREGKAISYWRLKAADGTPFGHRLWCDIEVKKVDQKVVKAAEMPAPVAIPSPPMSANVAPLPSYRQLPNEQPPAYESMNLSSRLAAMREQQKQRREQMIAQLNAQREQLNAHRESWGQNMNASPASNKNLESMTEKERRDILRQRVAHIKANIVKTREEREKLAQDLSKQKAAAAEKKADEAYEKMKNIIEQVAKQASDEEENDAEESLEGSQMVFPKLEKESPASSTYQSATSSSSKGKAAYVENEDGEVERSANPAPAPAPSTVASPSVEHDDFVDLDDELEVLSAADDSEDDGFLTDEEYDILDASDHETVASKY
ncbi:hypothetical protein HII31_00976 [Pseudocercospora fuligena]|uniref:ZZ-type domain-containing protein n=1 Tax=Pseudocercospora fuligena TaxID=685502 RepID=A0A8H6RVX8_9PEZI|nr:hypothetical protein HII31_00976 [Pseudocercospora fuligena]